MSTPKKPDEVLLWNSFGNDDSDFEWPHEAAEALGIPRKRMLYLVHKWGSAMIYDWGTYAGHGWKTSYYRYYHMHMRLYWLGK